MNLEPFVFSIVDEKILQHPCQSHFFIYLFNKHFNPFIIFSLQLSIDNWKYKVENYSPTYTHLTLFDMPRILVANQQRSIIYPFNVLESVKQQLVKFLYPSRCQRTWYKPSFALTKAAIAFIKVYCLYQLFSYKKSRKVIYSRIIKSKNIQINAKVGFK